MAWVGAREKVSITAMKRCRTLQRRFAALAGLDQAMAIDAARRTPVTIRQCSHFSSDS
jgi:hypothetical protein